MYPESTCDIIRSQSPERATNRAPSHLMTGTHNLLHHVMLPLSVQLSRVFLRLDCVVTTAMLYSRPDRTQCLGHQQRPPDTRQALSDMHCQRVSSARTWANGPSREIIAMPFPCVQVFDYGGMRLGFAEAAAQSAPSVSRSDCGRDTQTPTQVLSVQ